MVNVTKENFELFKKECTKWINYFGLKDWQVHYTHAKIERSRAQCCFNCVGRIATMTLNTKWDEINKDFVNDNNIKKTAFHEVCELMLGRLNDMVSQRYELSELDVEEEIHRIIRILENTVFEQVLNKEKNYENCTVL